MAGGSSGARPTKGMRPIAGIADASSARDDFVCPATIKTRANRLRRPPADAPLGVLGVARRGLRHLGAAVAVYFLHEDVPTTVFGIVIFTTGWLLSAYLDHRWRPKFPGA